MAVEITGHYTGNLKTGLRHGPSGTELATAAPVDNRGDGSSFSPTDLVAAALASCIVTTMAIVAEREGIDFRQASFRVEKHMADNPRRIGSLPVEIHMPPGLTDAQRKKLENAAHTCPVHRTLREDVEKEIRFAYPG
jgi:putative redox protein